MKSDTPPTIRSSPRLHSSIAGVVDILSAVKITDTADGLCVDPHGQGLLARQDLREGTQIPDRSAQWIDGVPDEVDYSSIQVPTLNGHFKIRWSGLIPFKSPTYYMNEARKGTQANIKWSWTRTERVDSGHTYVLLLVVIRFIRANEELLVVYDK